MPVEFNVLGPLTVETDIGPVVISGFRRRSLLLRLLLSANRPISSDRLLDDVWEDDPAVRSPSTLASHISLLRSRIGSDRIVRGPAGYLLVVDQGNLDAWSFEADAEGGRALLMDGNPLAALPRLQGALGRWRGPAYADVDGQEWARNEITRLTELRLSCEEDLITARLELGHHRELVPVAEVDVAASPYRELRWAQLMLALHRSGRSSDALRTFQRLRSLLGDELGIEPSADLVALEEAILLQKPELDWTDPPPPTQPASSGSPGRHRAGISASLPVHRTGLVGRTSELERLAVELPHRRLVSITGPGGVGKSRLALEFTRNHSDDEWDGFRWVELATLQEANQVPAVLATVLGIADLGGSRPEDVIVHWLADRSELVVLDNCEHLLESVAALIDRIVTDCPGITLLTTSRHPIGITGEVVLPLGPLAADEAASLFEVRVFEADASLTPAAGDHSTALRICERLEGVPLAIEIAAARARTLTFNDILELLPVEYDDSMVRNVPERHRSLRAAVDWSFRLLNEDQRQLFQRLSIFPAGFDLTAAISVGTEFGRHNSDVTAHLSQLVDHSMLLVDRSRDRTRYRMLEAIRDYGRRDLERSGAAAGTSDRHCTHYAERSVVLARSAYGPGPAGSVDGFDLEWDNLRTALDWSVRSGDLERASTILGSTAWFAIRTSRGEHRMWTEQVLALNSSLGRADPVVLTFAAKWAGQAGDQARALSLAQAAIDSASPGDPEHASAAVSAAFAHGYAGHYKLAEAAVHDAESSLALCRDRYTFIEGHAVLHPLIAVGYPDRTAEHSALVRRAAVELGNPLANAIVARMGVVELIRSGREREAMEALPAALETVRAAGATSIESELQVMALAAVFVDDEPDAGRFLAIANRFQDTEYGEFAWVFLEVVAIHWALHGRSADAAVLLGHLEVQGRRYPNPLIARFRGEYLDPLVTDPKLAPQLAKGATMTRKDLMRLTSARLTEWSGDTSP